LPLSSGKQQVVTGGVQWQQVASSHLQWHPVTSSGASHVQWRQSRPVAPVTSSDNRCLLVAVRSHFSLRLERRINPDRASNRILGRRIKGGELLPSWDPAFPFSGGLRPPEPPPVFVIVSDIRDSEIQSRSETSTVLVFHTCEGPTKLRRILLCNNCSTRYASSSPTRPSRAARSAAIVSIFPNTMTFFFNFRPCDNLSAGCTSRTHYCASVAVA
jgi:hypothetical protein